MVQDDERVGLDGVRVVFDDDRVVSDAGIALVATLAGRLGIEALVGRFVTLRRDRPGAANPGRGRAEARCRGFARSVSSARPPNRTCTSPRIRLSTGSCLWGECFSLLVRPGGGDSGAPVAVAADRDPSWPEHLGTAVAYLP